ncbi:MAG: carboxypeptidase regulatory-like domain-containing protein [Actinomycetota bacterium]
MFSSPLSRLSVLTLSLLFFAGIGARAADPGTVERVSVGTDESEGFSASTGPLSLSGDGRYVAFQSSNAFSGADFNFATDIYVRDRLSGLTQMVSLGNPATPAGQRVIPNASSSRPSISDDGRFVAFASNATNLVSGDTNNFSDVFVRDRFGGVIRVSVTSAGAQVDNNSGGHVQLSGDGHFVVYQSDATNLVGGDANTAQDVFVTEVDQLFFQGGIQVISTNRVSTSSTGVEGNGSSGQASVSYNGQYVAFSSDADNLDPDDTNASRDVFVKNIFTGELVRVSVDADGNEGDDNSTHPYISADGRFVAFVSDATNLVLDDTNGVGDVFVHDRDYDENGVFDEFDGINTVRVSISEFGDEGDDASGVDLFNSAQPGISADGRFVTFNSDASNLGADADFNFFTDIFVHDRDADGDGFFDDPEGVTTERVSVADTGEEADGGSTFAVISLDGSTIAFHSDATNLIFDDTNGATDVYVWTAFTAGSLNEPPDVVIANDDQFVSEGEDVLLDASGTTDPDGDILTYSWEQVGGESTVTLDNPNSATPTFTAPLVDNFDVLDFEVTVSDGVNEPEIGFATVTVGLATPANILGFITDGGGSAVVGAEVRIVRTDGSEASIQLSDGAGFYNAPDVRVGDNTVFVSAPGFETVTRDISVSPGEVINLDITLETTTATFRGNVLLANGAPMVGASVAFMDDDGEVIKEDTTDGTGEFTISDLTRFDIAAATTIQIEKSGYLTWLDANARIPLGATTQRRYQYGRLQVTVDTSPRKLRKLLNGTTVTLINQRDEHEEAPFNEANKKNRTLNFPNVPAGPVQVRAVNPQLTGVLTTTTVTAGRLTKLKVNLRNRNIF